MTAVLAGELHATDVVHVHDWALHVADVYMEGRSVCVVFVEFPNWLTHYAAADVLDVDVNYDPSPMVPPL